MARRFLSKFSLFAIVLFLILVFGAPGEDAAFARKWSGRLLACNATAYPDSTTGIFGFNMENSSKTTLLLLLLSPHLMTT